MIKSDLGNLIVLLVLLAVAGFGYYCGFISLVTRRAVLFEGRLARGRAAIGLGLLYLVGAVAASALGVLFYFSLNS